MWSAKQRAFLGLSKKEYELVHRLEKAPLNTSALAAKAKLPRVTTLRLLAKLWERGFVSRHKLNREVRWSAVSNRLLRKRLELGLSEREESSFGKLIPLSDIASVSVYKGVAEMMASNQKLLVAHAGERIYCIEPNAIWRHVVKIPATQWERLNNLLVRKNVIAEVVVEHGFDKVLQKFVPDILSESFFALAKDIRVMPTGAFPSPVEAIIFRDSALLLDWEQLVGVEVTSASMAAVLKGLFVRLQQNSVPWEKPVT